MILNTKQKGENTHEEDQGTVGKSNYESCHKRKKEHGKKLRRSFGETEILA